MKTGIFITVRTGSTRLPQKALKEIGERPIISYLIERLKKANDNRCAIVICTTELEEDKALDKIAKQYGIMCYHGEPENIVKRHRDCANSLGLDFVVNVDGDDILCSPEYAMKIVDFFEKDQSFDVVKSSHLPFGMNSMGYKTSVLEVVLQRLMLEAIDTGWGQLINDSSRFKIYEFPAIGSEKLEARLSLDYQEDFDTFKAIVEGFLKDNLFAGTKEIIEYLKRNPHIIEKNMHLNEIYWQNYNSKKVKEGR